MTNVYHVLMWPHKCEGRGRVQLFETPWTIHFMEFSRPEYWSGSHSLLQGIYPTHGSNPGLPHSRQILYQLSHQGSPRILEWVAYPFPRGSSQPRNQTRVSCLAGRFFYWLSYQGSPCDPIGFLPKKKKKKRKENKGS